MIQNLFQTSAPAEHRGITIAPLFPRQNPVAAYLTLDEALASGLRIRETSESGSVPELLVENPLAERVLLYDGEELVGAKQNRILNVSVLVEAKSTLTIPVSCVEQGRWRDVSTTFGSGSHISHAELRRRKAEVQAAQPLARGISQAGRGVGRGAREVSTDAGLLPARERARISTATTSATCVRSRAPSRRSRGSVVPSSESDPTSASTWFPGRTPSPACGRSFVPATCLMRSSASTASRRQRAKSSACSPMRGKPS